MGGVCFGGFVGSVSDVGSVRFAWVVVVDFCWSVSVVGCGVANVSVSEVAVGVLIVAIMVIVAATVIMLVLAVIGECSDGCGAYDEWDGVV